MLQGVIDVPRDQTDIYPAIEIVAQRQIRFGSLHRDLTPSEVASFLSVSIVRPEVSAETAIGYAHRRLDHPAVAQLLASPYIIAHYVSRCIPRCFDVLCMYNCRSKRKAPTLSPDLKLLPLSLCYLLHYFYLIRMLSPSDPPRLKPAATCSSTTCYLLSLPPPPS